MIQKKKIIRFLIKIYSFEERNQKLYSKLLFLHYIKEKKSNSLIKEIKFNKLP